MISRRLPAASVLITMALFGRGALLRAADEWQPQPVREEIRPSFERLPDGDEQSGPTLLIRAGDVEGTAGAWVRRFPVQGGQFYKFSAQRLTRDVASPRRSTPAKISWQDDQGRLVQGYGDDLARPDYPSDAGQTADGWSLLEDVYRAPPQATYARVELQLRWATRAEVRWRAVSFRKTSPPQSRKVRLAAVHFRPRQGSSAAANREMFAPYITEAARQKADLVCLGEAVTLVGTGLTYVDVAESIPGPSTDFFGSLARQHDLYIVAGLMERSGAAVYNTAVLLGPDGSLVGKYRKVCLPREEIEGGVTPGSEYPVFETRFGRVGLMVCWDVHFPEVARNLSVNGAEVIAMPIWGGNPALAAARAIENQIFLVSSTYSDPQPGRMKSGIWDQEGKLLAVGKEWGEVQVAEVDLAQRKHWSWLGDFKARIHRERPSGGFRD